MNASKATRKEVRKQAAYLLPISLIRRIKKEAKRRASYPATIVDEAVTEWFDRQPPQPAA